VFVDRRVAPGFEELLVAAVGKFQPGDPLLPETNLGPLISAAAVARYEQLAAARADWLILWFRPKRSRPANAAITLARRSAAA
jgi:acyl-CoA reductase-like NAD-dependent aldehyde dehydrogenase